MQRLFQERAVTVCASLTFSSASLSRPWCISSPGAGSWCWWLWPGTCSSRAHRPRTPSHWSIWWGRAGGCSALSHCSDMGSAAPPVGNNKRLLPPPRRFARLSASKISKSYQHIQMKWSGNANNGTKFCHVLEPSGSRNSKNTVILFQIVCHETITNRVSLFSCSPRGRRFEPTQGPKSCFCLARRNHRGHRAQLNMYNSEFYVINSSVFVGLGVFTGFDPADLKSAQWGDSVGPSSRHWHSGWKHFQLKWNPETSWTRHSTQGPRRNTWGINSVSPCSPEFNRMYYCSRPTAWTWWPERWRLPPPLWRMHALKPTNAAGPSRLELDCLWNFQVGIHGSLRGAGSWLSFLFIHWLYWFHGNES